jgi:hypothetical protein
MTFARRHNLEYAAANERPTKSHLIGILEIAPCWKPARGARNRDSQRRQKSMQIRRRSLSWQVEIRCDDHLPGALALHTLNQFTDLELIGSNAFDW